VHCSPVALLRLLPLPVTGAAWLRWCPSGGVAQQGRHVGDAAAGLAQ
jgi:hypothetical protein